MTTDLTFAALSGRIPMSIMRPASSVKSWSIHPKPRTAAGAHEPTSNENGMPT